MKTQDFTSSLRSFVLPVVSLVILIAVAAIFPFSRLTSLPFFHQPTSQSHNSAPTEAHVTTETPSTQPLPATWLDAVNVNAGKKSTGCVAAQGYEYLCEPGYDQREDTFNQLQNGLSPDGLWWAKVTADHKLQLISTKNSQVLTNQSLGDAALNFQTVWSPDSHSLLVVGWDNSDPCKLSSKCLKSGLWFAQVDTTQVQLTQTVSAPGDDFSNVEVAWSPDSSQLAIHQYSQKGIVFFTRNGEAIRTVKIPQTDQFSNIISLVWKDPNLFYSTLSVQASHVDASHVFVLPATGSAKPKEIINVPISIVMADWDHTSSDSPLLIVSENRAIPLFEDTRLWLMSEQGNTRHLDLPNPGQQQLGGGTYCGVQPDPAAQITAIALSSSGSCDSNMNILFLNWQTLQVTQAGTHAERLLPWSPVLQAFPVIVKDPLTGVYQFKTVTP